MSAATGPGSVLSLPQGGGAQRSIGENFTADLFTGTGNARIALALPPGRNGFAPELSLSYGSGSGNGIFGIGWSVAIPQVARRTAFGLPTYDDETDTFSCGADSLVRNAPGADAYTQRTDAQFTRIRHRGGDSRDEWTVETRDGLVTVYGPDESSRIVDPSAPGRIFAWLLSRTTDAFGNTIVYEYKRLRDPSGEYEQVLPSAIHYGDYGDASLDYLVKVEFVYEDRPDHFSSRRAGFEIRTTQRVAALVITTAVGGVERLFRRYRIAYHPDSLIGNGASLIRSVVAESDDGVDTEMLPPVEYTYVPFDPAARTFSPVSGDVPTDSLADPDQDVLDAYGCGLPGILRLNGTPRFWANAGNCRVQEPLSMRDSPAGFNLSDPGVALLDADGDGRLDLMVNDGQVAGYFPISRDGNWDSASFQAYRAAPPFDPKDLRVRFLDLDGNGVTDALRSGTRLECFFNDPTTGWNKTRYLERGALPGLDLDFTDPRVFIADMTGDGLQDVVLVHSGSVTYWPSLGYGRFGSPVRMAGAPRLPYDYDPRRVVLGDVDGDGAADLLYVDNGRTFLWINRSGRAFAEAFVCDGTPTAGAGDSFRLVDFSGGGVAGLLYSRAASGDGRPNYHFLDFTGGRKPYLLARMKSGAMTTEIDFVSSTRYYLDDAQRPETRWKTTLPFPVQVVAAIRRHEAITDSVLTSVFKYRHGYWDGVEREFRGFGRVEQVDSSDSAASDCPPSLTVSWFNLGPVGAELDWKMPTFAEEYWPGDPPYLPAAILPGDLQRRDERDAARALRGTLMRAELYGLDNTAFSTAPYTVTEESTVAVTIVDPRTTAPNKRGAFFPCATGKRVTQWERGNDPRTNANFWKNFDSYGQPRLLIDVAVPRGRDFRTAATQDLPYLVGTTSAQYAVPIDPDRYHASCVATVTQRQFPNDGHLALDELVAAIVAEPAHGAVTAQAFHYYDGEAFIGVPLGSIGAWGANTRTEQFAFSREALVAAYASPDGPKLPPYLETEGPPPWTADYPPEFREQLAPLAGYVYYPPGDPVRAAGYWFNAERTRYDVQDGIGRGMKIQSLDPMGNSTTYAYDAYAVFPSTITDSVGLSTSTEYDKRLLTPLEMTDENGNRERVRRSPLGFQVARWIMGKHGESVGDTEAQPSTRWIYELSARPVSIRTVQREYYASDTSIPPAERDATIASVQYLDGFGRSLQVRNQAETLVVGDAFGRIAFDTAWNCTSEGARHAEESVAISAAQRYDFKGRVIGKYQPAMGTGWAYSVSELGSVTRIHYDPRGRTVRTINPDSSMRLVVRGVPADLATPEHFAPNPWDTYLYDENDNAGRTDPEGSKPWESHWNTPGSNSVDALGRTIIAVERNGTAPSDWVTTTSTYDLPGNLLTVTDARGRVAFRADYDRRQKRMRTELLDSGVQRFVLDAAGREVESRDAKGALTLHAYDALSRCTTTWARNDAAEAVTRRQKIVYGDDRESGLTREEAAQRNLLTRPYLYIDDLGTLRYEAYDFKGNQVRKTRRVEAGLGLDFATDVRFDALDRIRVLTTPADVDAKRHVLALRYDRAGALNGIRLDEQDIVVGATYCAQGDRTSLTYAGGVVISVEYDPLRFRPIAIKTQRQGTPELLQANRYRYDLVGNPLEIESTAPGCGLPGSPDKLTRTFRFDPLYRVLSGDGREAGEAQFPPWNNNARPEGVDKARAYAELFTYDVMGNLTSLDHRSASGAYRRAMEIDPARNRVTHMSIGSDRIDYRYDACGNITGEGARSFGWDYRNRLVSFDSGEGVRADYLRDGAGVRTVQRVETADRVETTVYVDQLLEYRQVEVGGKLIKGNLLHIRDGNRHLAIVRYGADPTGDDGPALTLQIADEMGSGVIAFGLDGWKNVEEYAPYGETVYGSYPAKRYRYTDHPRDEESALYDTEARAYMPYLGRWLSVDPEGLADGPNPYAYVGGNPLRYVDPRGTQGEENQQTTSARVSTTGASDPNARALATTGFNLNTTVKWMFQPRDHATGQWMHEMYNLWSGNGKDLASKSFGYIMGQTKHHIAAIRFLTNQGWVPGKQMPKNIWDAAWEMTSLRAARDAALSMVPVRSFGIATPDSIQTRIEWPTVRNYGVFRSALVSMSGVGSFVGGALTNDQTDRSFLLSGGVLQLVSAKFWGAGVVFPNTFAMAFGSRMFAFGGVVSAIPALRAVPGAYQRSAWDEVMSMGASGVSPMVMLTGMLARNPVVMRYGAMVGVFGMCVEFGRLGYGWIGPTGGTTNSE